MELPHQPRPSAAVHRPRPGAQLRDIAAALDITERTAYGIVADLTAAGYVVKEKAGRRNRYDIQGHLPLHESISRERTIGEVLDLLVDLKPRRAVRAPHEPSGDTAPAPPPGSSTPDGNRRRSAQPTRPPVPT